MHELFYTLLVVIVDELSFNLFVIVVIECFFPDINIILVVVAAVVLRCLFHSI